MVDKQYKSTKAVFKQLLSFIKPYYLWVVLRVFCTVAKAAIDIATVWFVQVLINSALAGNQEELIKSICLMLGFICIEVFMYFISTYSSGRFGANVAQDLRESISNHIAKLPLDYIEKHHSGDLVSRLNNDITQLEEYLKGSFMDFLFEIIRFIGSFFILTLINWKLLCICIIVISIAMLLSNKISSPMSKYSEQIQKKLARSNSIVQDSISGIHVLKAFNLQMLFENKYKDSIEQTLVETFDIEKRNAMIRAVSVIINLVPIIICFLIGGYLVVINEFTAGGLVAFAQMLTFMGQAAGALPRYISQFRNNIGVARHIFEVLNESLECVGGKDYDINIEELAVEFTDVSFSYTCEKKVIDNLTFKITHGSTVGLVGFSGSGKTTVFKLLCGLYEPSSGEIKLYGRYLNEWNKVNMRSLISVVSQDTYLFKASIAENIAYGRPGATFDEVVEVAKKLNAHDFIMRLPDGYNTIVGERGIKLSGGQRQCISIARAILKDAPIILLDEPSSALDAESESTINNAIESFIKNKTVLIIAHRLSTIRYCDNILVLNKGKIVETGIHDKLLQLEGVYKQLYYNQLNSDNDSLVFF